MDFTGERFIPSLKGDIRLEHLHRYEWCMNFVHGKRVLDIACGEGYGSCMLADSASSVIGVDISKEAVEHAQTKYSKYSNLEFIVGDAAEIPLKNKSIDVVISFETIEHHSKHHEMLAEIKRILVDDGILIISSPNKKIYSDLAGSNHNHYHIKELYFNELSELLFAFFKEVKFYGQRVNAASFLYPLDIDYENEKFNIYTEKDNEIVKYFSGNFDPMYYLAVASNIEYSPPMNISAMVSELSNPFYEKQREVLHLNAEIFRLSEYIAEITAVLASRDNDLLALKKTTTIIHFSKVIKSLFFEYISKIKSKLFKK